MDECIKRAEVLWLIYNGQIMTGDNAKDSAQTLVKEIPAADVVPREKYVELQAENCKLKNQVRLLKKKIKDMKSDASWDEDIRRGQVQGMW